MKSILSSLFITLGITLSAQSYIPINTQDTTGVWSVFKEKLYFKGDSLFDGHIYKKIYHYEDSVFDFNKGNFLTLFRQDSTGKSWTRVPGRQERLLFDLDVKPGDTLKIYPVYSQYHSSFYSQVLNESIKILGQDSGIYCIMQKIDTILQNGIPSRRIEYLAFDTNIQQPIINIPSLNVIEGIGGSTGLLYNGLAMSYGSLKSEDLNNSFVIDFYTYQMTLLCYHEDDSLIYEDPFFPFSGFPNTDRCYANWAGKHNSIHELSTQSLKIFPNPNTGSLQVALPHSEGPARLRILSMNGQVLHEQDVEMSGGQSERLELKLSSGMYLAEIQNATGVFFGRCVVR